MATARTKSPASVQPIRACPFYVQMYSKITAKDARSACMSDDLQMIFWCAAMLSDLRHPNFKNALQGRRWAFNETSVAKFPTSVAKGRDRL
jgi:hypothetical protein